MPENHCLGEVLDDSWHGRLPILARTLLDAVGIMDQKMLKVEDRIEDGGKFNYHQVLVSL